MDTHISAKTTLTATGGAATTLIIWAAQPLGLEIPAEAAAAIVTVATALIAWLVPAKSGTYVYTEPVIPESELIEDTSDSNGESDYDDPDQSLDGLSGFDDVDTEDQS